MARPSVLPLFSTASGRARPVAFELDGYPEGFPPPSNNHNWQFGTIGDWLQYLDERATPFETLADFIAETVPGEYGYVWRPPGANGPFELEQTVTSASQIGPICADGERVFVATGTTIQALDPADLTVVLATYTLSATATAILRMNCNGTHLIVKYETAANDVYDLFLVDGTLAGTRTDTLSSTAGTPQLDGTHAYVTTTNTVQKVPLASFSAGLTSTYDHTAIITWIGLHGQVLVVSGAARVSDQGAALIGDRLVGVLPAGSPMTPLWGTTRVLSSAGATTSDGQLIYSVSGGSGAELQLTNFGIGIANRADMTVLETVGVNHNDGEHVDDRYFYLLSQGLLYVYDKSTFGCVARLSVDETETDPGAVCSDGDQVYAASRDTGVSSTLRRYSIRTGTPRLFGRQDPTKNGKTVHQLLAVAR